MFIFNLANFIIVKPQIVGKTNREINLLSTGRQPERQFKKQTDNSRNKSGRFIGIDLIKGEETELI
jgi:hypothetical protein